VKTPAVPDDALYTGIRDLLVDARAHVARSINTAMVRTYWNIGGLIDDHLQAETRSESYGTDLMGRLSAQLTSEFGKGFDTSNLSNMLQFFRGFEIHDAPRHESPTTRVLVDVALSWTHYRRLIRVHNPAARRWYHDEAAAAGWSTRELDRQITTSYYERGLTTSDAQPAELVVPSGQFEPSDVLRDPYVLEFLGVPDQIIDAESELEQALIDQLKAFLLELGRGFSFVGRQQRISIDGVHYRVDLVFYHYVLKCFVLIDLKSGALDHRDIGQMDFYVRYWETEVRRPDDNPTIGLILCAEKSEAMARYTLLSDHRSVFAAKYLPYLPSEEELQDELERVRLAYEVRKVQRGDD
jgi:predicted nuclease of restriction endonuclease-like (RecB) superfamily